MKNKTVHLNEKKRLVARDTLHRGYDTMNKYMYISYFVEFEIQKKKSHNNAVSATNLEKRIK